MAHSLPLLKLGGLVIKTLAKPLSKQIKHEFSRYELTQQLLKGIGETSHQITSRLTIWSAGYRVRDVKPLEAEKALKDGSELLGESVIFLTSGVWMWYEYNKSNDKSKAKEEAQKAVLLQERQEILSQIEALSDRLNQVETALETTQESLQKLVSLQLYYTGMQAPPPPSAGSSHQIDDKDGRIRIISIGDNNDDKSRIDSSQHHGTRSNSQSAATAASASGRPWWRPW